MSIPGGNSEMVNMTLDNGHVESIDRSVFPSHAEKSMEGKESNLKALAEAKEAGRLSRLALSEGKELSDSEVGKLLSDPTLKLAIYLDKVGSNRMSTTEEPPRGSTEYAEWKVGNDLVDRADRLTDMASSFESLVFKDRREGGYAFQYLANIKESMLQEGLNTDRLKAFMIKVQEKVADLPQQIAI
jgi:hypothetical protein